MVSLWLWRSGHCPSLFPLVSTPPMPRSHSRRRAVTWNVASPLHKPRLARISPVTSALKMAARGCDKCSGQGAIECPGCKGTRKSKKNGNIFQRWKCYECQGFGLMSCPTCGKRGLTPGS